MLLDPQEIKQRWSTIRARKECDLSLDPLAVAQYLGKPEHELVQDRIRETLNQMARYRRERDTFSGDLAICEGLETFLVPAVERALTFSSFIEQFRGTAPERDAFIEAFVTDVGKLLDHWGRNEFSAQPYSNEDAILNAIQPITRDKDKIKRVNITEAGAMACRVLIHLLTLKLNPSKEERDGGHFEARISARLDHELMFTCLTNAITFLVNAFQKGDGKDDEERIVRSRTGDEVGSGWSWSDRAGLPPILFFTAAAVDAFAELDLYLIRPATDPERPLEQGTPHQQSLLTYYKSIETSLEQFQACVEMSRLWVQATVLPNLSTGMGEHPDPAVTLFRTEEKKYNDHYKPELEKTELEHSPLVFYNTLYSLQILLWAWADQDTKGEEIDPEAQNKINRALSQLVFNYDRIPVVRRVLSTFPYQFYLPGAPKFFIPAKEGTCEYLDSAFLPLLTRLLVLYVAYGVGDRNLLEPVVRDLYVELLQNRNRRNLDFSALWSEEDIEIFSTQRAIQALTFYHAYARGKELVTAPGAAVAPGRASGDTIELRNRTGHRLILQAVSEDSVATTSLAPAKVAEVPKPFRFPVGQTFSQYAASIGVKPDLNAMKPDHPAHDLVNRASGLGNEIMSSVDSEVVRDIGAAKLILNALARVVSMPIVDKTLREAEFQLLSGQFQELNAERAAGANAG